MNNLLTRSVTGLVFGLVMISAALLGQLAAAVLFFIINYAGLREFFKLITKENQKPEANLGLTVGSTVYTLIALAASGYLASRYLVLIIPLIMLFFIAELWRKNELPFLNIGYNLLGVFYISIPLGLMIGLFKQGVAGIGHYGTYLGFLILLWVNDTFAYFTGSLVGKHKLFERISPKKTIEGSAGGAFFTLISGYILSSTIPVHSLSEWLIIAAIIIVTGTLGDLVESMLKRSLQIKDSGSILPGHGGILDRFDAVLISVPFVFAYLVLIS